LGPVVNGFLSLHLVLLSYHEAPLRDGKRHKKGTAGSSSLSAFLFFI